MVKLKYFIGGIILNISFENLHYSKSKGKIYFQKFVSNFNVNQHFINL